MTILGVDVERKMHYARASDWRDTDLGNALSFDNNKIGRDKL
jgi:hypothetical protein